MGMTRDERLRALIDAYSIDQQFAPGEADQYAVIGTGGLAGDPDSPGEKIAKTYPHRGDALRGAEDLILDGYSIDGIVDLDTGKAFGVAASVLCDPVAAHTLDLPWA